MKAQRSKRRAHLWWVWQRYYGWVQLILNSDLSYSFAKWYPAWVLWARGLVYMALRATGQPYAFARTKVYRQATRHSLDLPRLKLE